MASNRKSKNSTPTTKPEIQPALTPIEMTTLAWQLRKEMTSVMEAVAEMKQSQSFLSEQLDKLKEMTEDQQYDQHQTMSSIIHMEVTLQRAKRVKNLMIFGYPAMPKEDTVCIVLQIASVLGCQVPREAIEEASRVPGKRSPPIRVVFSAESYKRELMKSAKKFGPLMPRNLDPTFEGNWRILLRDEIPKHKLNNFDNNLYMKFFHNMRYRETGPL